MQTVQLPGGYAWACDDADECWVVYNEIFERRCYDRADDPVPPGGVIVDVGAHVGLFALYSALTWRPARHVAIEAAPPAVDLLRHNVAANRLDGVQVVHAAVGDGHGTATLTYFPQLPGNSTLHPEVKQAELAAFGPRSRRRMKTMFDEGVRYEVPVRPLGDLLPGDLPGRIELLKVDVESAEAAVLRGISADVWPHIARVVVEVSHYLPDGLATVTDLLRGRGMDVRVTEPQTPSITALVWAVRPDTRPPAANAEAQRRPGR
jgi:FkbM family methyltransferase